MARTALDPPGASTARSVARRAQRLACGLTIAAAAAASTAIAAEPVVLTIRNAAEVPLRCVLVLAHFVTQEHPSLPPGATMSLALQRDAAAGTLSIARADGTAMMVENLLCGATDRWEATRGEVPLLALRGATAERMATTCAIERRRLACTPPLPADAM
jgi:hypothetical protein